MRLVLAQEFYLIDSNDELHTAFPIETSVIFIWYYQFYRIAINSLAKSSEICVLGMDRL